MQSMNAPMQQQESRNNKSKNNNNKTISDKISQNNDDEKGTELANIKPQSTKALKDSPSKKNLQAQKKSK